MEINKTFKDMKNTTKLFLAVALAVTPQLAAAQKKSDPMGLVTYALPSTTITLDVEAVQENFHAGPYAKFAEKYLGITPRYPAFVGRRDADRCVGGASPRSAGRRGRPARPHRQQNRGCCLTTVYLSGKLIIRYCQCFFR